MVDGGKSKRPPDTNFRQQNLRACRPILSPKCVFAIFFLVGAAFIPIGIAILMASSQVVEATSADYSSTTVSDGGCLNSDGETDANPCRVEIVVPAKMEPPVYFYYKLSNFYQNHRRYVKSRFDRQLRAYDGYSAGYTPKQCGPICTYKYTIGSEDASSPDWTNAALTVSPCGLIADSYFNDTFKLLDGSKEVPMKEEGIAWPSDVELKYKNSADGTTGQNYAQFAYERKQTCDSLAGNERKGSSVQKCKEANVPQAGWCYPGSGYCTEDEHFMVWMRTAGLPTFRKLYGIIDTPLEAGTYTVQVANGRPCAQGMCNPSTGARQTKLFPVREFSGEKQLVLSTSSALGGKNDFLGYTYLVVGVACVVMAIAFAVKHTLRPRPAGAAPFVMEHAAR